MNRPRLADGMEPQRGNRVRVVNKPQLNAFDTEPHTGEVGMSEGFNGDPEYNALLRIKSMFIPQTGSILAGNP